MNDRLIVLLCLLSLPAMSLSYSPEGDLTARAGLPSADSAYGDERQNGLVHAHSTQVGNDASPSARHGTMHPQRVLWMQHAGGWGEVVISELTVTLHGDFEWKKRLLGDAAADRYETKIGHFSASVLASLVQQVVQARPGPAIDDADVVGVWWRNETNSVHSRIYYLPDELAAGLLETIEMLVRMYGRAP